MEESPGHSKVMMVGVLGYVELLVFIVLFEAK